MEMILTRADGAELVPVPAQQLLQMAELLRVTNERMAALEQLVRRLEKVTPAQAGEINRAIRERAAAVCAAYRMEGQEQPVASAIRRSVRQAAGVTSAKDISRCDYQPLRALIAEWDEYSTIRDIKRKGRKRA